MKSFTLTQLLAAILPLAVAAGCIMPLCRQLMLAP